MDWSKYTDEGWYGDAAIRHYELGHWYVPGDFNPAAALPVWPLLEAVLFRFTGVSLAGARALTVCVFGGILLAGYALLRRWEGVSRSLSAGAGSRGVFCWPSAHSASYLRGWPFWSRCWCCLRCWRCSRRARCVTCQVLTISQELLANLRPVLAMGVLLPALILTKTTGLFLVPSIAFLLWAAVGFRLRAWLRIGMPAAGLGGALWLVYYLGVVRPHYLLDYRYLFSANAYTQITLATAGTVLHDTLTDGTWMGAPIYWDGGRVRGVRGRADRAGLAAQLAPAAALAAAGRADPVGGRLCGLSGLP